MMNGILKTITYPSSDDFSKDNMASVQPRSFLGSDEELRPVGIFSSIGH